MNLLTGRYGNHALPPLLLTQMRHLVVRAPQLEAKDRLQVLPLEQDAAFQPCAKVLGMMQRRLLDCFVHPRREDELHVLEDGDN